jgi:hypothetical protein
LHLAAYRHWLFTDTVLIEIPMLFAPLVRKERLELSRVAPLAPKASASTIPPLSRIGRPEKDD